MLQVQLGSWHHSWSVRLLLGPRSQVCRLTRATIMPCNKWPQNWVAKSNTPLSYGSRGHLGQLCFTLQVYRSEFLPWSRSLPLPEGLWGHIPLKVMAKAQEEKKKHAKPCKALTKNWHYHFSPISWSKAKGQAQCHKAEDTLPMTGPW